MHQRLTFRSTVSSQQCSLKQPQCPRRFFGYRLRAHPGEKPSEGNKGLRAIIKRKQQELAAHLSEYDDDVVEERLATALHTENPNPHRLAQLVPVIKMTKGRPILIFELHRSLLQENGKVTNLETLAQCLESSSADCLCLSTDRSSSEGLKDLFTVSRSVKIPVLARDWYIHPLQILEAKEAGASGIIGVIACVSVHGTPLLSSFAAAIGIDAPVEVLNVREVEEMTKHGVPMFCVNCSVGLSLSGIAGIASDVTKGILSSLPFGSVSVVGIKKMKDLQSAAQAGADALLIKHTCIPPAREDFRDFVGKIQYITSGDD